jgi:hypothetical protein
MKLPKKERETELVRTINDWKFTKSNGIYYMYYDSINGEPMIFADPEFE